MTTTTPRRPGRPKKPGARRFSVHSAVDERISKAIDKAAKAAGVTLSRWVADAIEMRLLRSEDGGEG